MIGVVSDQEITQLTRMGDLDMLQPASGAMGLLKKLKPAKTSGKAGAGQMKMLRRIPKILKLIPGKSQDLRAWFLSMQYWLGGSDDNIENMIRFLIARYTHVARWRLIKAKDPVEYPEVGLYHPDLTGSRHHHRPCRSATRNQQRDYRPANAAQLYPCRRYGPL